MLQWMKHCLHCGKHLIWTPDLSANAADALEELWSNLNERDAVHCAETLVLGRIVGGVGCHWQQKVDTLLAGTWSKWDGWGLKENEKVEEKKEEEVLAASWPESDISQGAANAPPTHHPPLLIPWNNKWKAVISAAGHISQMTQPRDGNMEAVEWHKRWRGELWCGKAKFTFCLPANIKKWYKFVVSISGWEHEKKYFE